MTASLDILIFLLDYYLLLPLCKINLLFPTPVSTLAQDCKMKVTLKHQILLFFFLLSLNIWWFAGFLQWFLRLNQTMVQTIQSALGEKHMHNYASFRHTDAILNRVKPEQGNSYNAAALSKQKWHSPLFCSQHLYFGICPFEKVQGVGSPIACDRDGI